MARLVLKPDFYRIGSSSRKAFGRILPNSFLEEESLKWNFMLEIKLQVIDEYIAIVPIRTLSDFWNVKLNLSLSAMRTITIASTPSPVIVCSADSGCAA